MRYFFRNHPVKINPFCIRSHFIIRIEFHDFIFLVYFFFFVYLNMQAVIKHNQVSVIAFKFGKLRRNFVYGSTAYSKYKISIGITCCFWIYCIFICQSAAPNRSCNIFFRQKTYVHYIKIFNPLGEIILTHRNIDFVYLKKAFHLFKMHIAFYVKEIYFFLYPFLHIKSMFLCV